MARMAEVDEYSLSAERAAAEDVFRPPPLVLRPRLRVPWTALAIAALAVAVVFHAMAGRYQSSALGETLVVRTDRLTGHVVGCWAVTLQGCWRVAPVADPLAARLRHSAELDPSLKPLVDSLARERENP